MKKDKKQCQEQNLAEHLGGLANFAILKKHASSHVRKERLSQTSKSRRQASRNNFMKKSGRPDRGKSLREVQCRKNCPRALLGLSNPSEMD